MPHHHPTADCIEAVFRREYGRIIAGLIRRSRSFDLAEEALQDAFTIAARRWPTDGIPDNPAAWITTTATRRLIDAVRREHTRLANEDQLLYETPTSTTLEAIEQSMNPDEDDRLRLIFTCCHPALNQQAQIALTLRTLGGLTTSEIARAFLVPESTLAQRLVRAQRKITEARIPYEIPSLDQLPARLSAVQTVLYLVFNEGYSATHGDSLVRRELCAEAIRLARILNLLLPDNPESMALLALMLLHDSRREARCQNDQLITLEEQDRTLWNHEQVAEGIRLVERALGRRNPGPYQLQAAIAALHAEAATPEATDWKQIAALYSVLHTMQPTPVIALNHAVAVAMTGSSGPSGALQQGLDLIDNLSRTPELANYYLTHAARADLLRRMQRPHEAIEAYTRAIALTRNAIERRYLERRIAELTVSAAS